MQEAVEKRLYDYQEKDLKNIFDHIDNSPSDYNLLYQLLH